jgi:hypothetical protein
MEMTCPEHNVPLVDAKDAYGRMKCPIKKCSVVCYPGKTSTPANAETRKARLDCHNMMDIFWKSGLITRAELYKRLQIIFQKEVHIGQMNLEECQRVLKFVTKIRLKIAEIVRKEFNHATC